VITGFSHVYLSVLDVDEAVRFYTGRLGFRLLRKWRAGDGPEAAYAELGGVLLEITQTASDVSGGSAGGERRFGLVVDDLDAVLAELRSSGVEIASEPFEPRSFWGRQAAIRDPFGYIVALREWRPPDGPHFDGWQPTRSDVVRTA
jgi:catechol 2,3-dioxygenase-like lactoylglutathione lyase family enzyme